MVQSIYIKHYLRTTEVFYTKFIKDDMKRNFTFWSKYNLTNNYCIPYQMHYHTILTTSYHISITMILKSLISKLSWVCTTLARGYCMMSPLPNIRSATACLQVSWQVGGQNISGMSSPTALNHVWKESQTVLIVRNWLQQVHRWTQSYPCHRHPAPVHNESWIGVYLFVFV